MVDLIAKTPCAGLLLLTIGDMTLTEVSPGAVTSLAPYRGQEAALSQALQTVHGLTFPAPNRSTGRDGMRCLWMGRGQAMLLGPEADAGLAQYAALTDQSDAWAVVRLDGARAEDVLARLVPLDLSRAAFKRGHTARTLAQHMTVSVTRVGDAAFQIMAFRSMAATLVHDLSTAMSSVAARGAGDIRATAG